MLYSYITADCNCDVIGTEQEIQELGLEVIRKTEVTDINDIKIHAESSWEPSDNPYPSDHVLHMVWLNYFNSSTNLFRHRNLQLVSR